MALPRTLSFGSFKIYLGDGASSPEVFTAPCGFTQKSLSLDADTSDFQVPDCDSPEAPAWTVRSVVALSAAINGQGVLAMAANATWRDWWKSGAEKNIRVEYDDTGANGGGYWQGPAILTSLGDAVALNADGSLVQRSVALVSSGEWTWTNAA